MSRAIVMPQTFKERDTFGFFDDFEWFISPHRWTKAAASTGSSSVSSTGVGGLLSILSAATDNDDASTATTNAIFKFAQDKPFVAEARLQFTEANTSAANMVFGLSSTVGANTMINDGGGPVASASQALFYKIDGETYWHARSQIGAAVGRTDNTPSTTANPNTGCVAVTAGGSSYQTLRIEFNPYNSGSGSANVGDVLFKIDDTLIAHHKLTFTNAVAMYLVAGVKAGSANVETLVADYMGAYQVR